MSVLTVPDVDDDLIARLEARARRNGRTLTEEVRAILTSSAAQPDPVWERVNHLREEIAATGRPQTDGVELLREDRDR